ncbi:hypothetical protein N656DRAFT_601984 [Canariomyces notabilis]|uniref:Pre-mRNA splicing factor n=1 Tax=Canariomyces notabilis TaxID=2074819 RepID=A0AAN6TG63_9PEZI|nr:hypothetical protein N656DRAFT_601984 [Canariomyces arenarius]
MVTRNGVYLAGVIVSIVALALTISSIASPRWISYRVLDPAGGIVVDASIGLHQRCKWSAGASSSRTCGPFPGDASCDGGRASFCSMWRTAGFLMNFAVAAELATIAGFVLVSRNARVKRHGGWKILGFMLVVVAAAQFLSMAVVVSHAYLFDHDDLFLVPGYYLDSSWYLCLSSAIIALLCAFGLAIAAYALPPEDGYQFLHDSSDV